MAPVAPGAAGTGAGAAASPFLPPSELRERSGEASGKVGQQLELRDHPSSRLRLLRRREWVRERTKGWMGKNPQNQAHNASPQLSVPFVLLLPSLQPAASTFCFTLLRLPWGGTQPPPQDFGTEVPPPRTARLCEPLLEGLAGLSPPRRGARRVRAAPLRPVVLWDVRAQQGMLPAGMPGGQSIPLFPRSPGRFTALLAAAAAAAALKSLFMPKAKAVASRFARSGEKENPPIAKQPPDSSTLKGNAGEFTI